MRASEQRPGMVSRILHFLSDPHRDDGNDVEYHGAAAQPDQIPGNGNPAASFRHASAAVVVAGSPNRDSTWQS